MTKLKLFAALGLSLLFCLSFTGLGDSFWPRLLELMQAHQPPGQDEKIYAHSDRRSYRPGEVLRASVYILDAQTHKPGQSERFIWELRNAKDEVLEKQELLAPGGRGEIGYPLNPMLKGGSYKLRVYTPDSLARFERDIEIEKPVLPKLDLRLDFERQGYRPGEEVRAYLSAQTLENRPLVEQEVEIQWLSDGKTLHEAKAKTDAQGQLRLSWTLPADGRYQDDLLLNLRIAYRGQAEALSRAVPLASANLDLQFMPEGGAWLANSPQRLGFKALNQWGKAADVSGQVRNRRGETVAELRSYHLGMGYLDFRAQVGESYQAHLDNGQIIPLPVVESQGLGLRLDPKAAGTGFELQIQSSQAQTLHLLWRHNGRALGQESLEAKAGLNRLSQTLKDYPLGPSSLTVFDAQGRVLAERLVFVGREQSLQFSFSTPKEKYLPREEVQLDIKVSDAQGRPVSGSFSLAVLDQALLSIRPDRQGHILSHLLLQSELKGHIEDPDFYFERHNDSLRRLPNINRDRALDNLMLCQAWRQYSWPELLQSPPKIRPEHKAKLAFAGQILDAETGLPLAKAEYRLYGYNHWQNSDAEGRFTQAYLPESHYPQAFYNFLNYAQGPVMLVRAEGYPLHRFSLGYFDDKLQLKLHRQQLLRVSSRYGQPYKIKAWADAKRLKSLENNVFILPASFRKLKFKASRDWVRYSRRKRRKTSFKPIRISREALLNSSKPDGAAEEDWLGGQQAINLYFRPRFRFYLPWRYGRYRKLKGRRMASPAFNFSEIETSRSRSSETEPRALRLRGLSPEPVSRPLEASLSAVDLSDLNPSSEVQPAQRPNSQSATYSARETLVFQGQIHKLYPWLMRPDSIRPWKNSDNSPSVKFYAPKYKPEEAGQGLRQDFRLTLHWEPRLEVKEGQAQVRFFCSDALTQFAVQVEGLSQAGQAGRGEYKVYTQKPLELELRLPEYLMQGDEPRLALSLRNNLEDSQTLGLSFKLPDGLSWQTQAPFSAQLAPKSSQIIELPLKVNRPNKGWIEVAAKNGQNQTLDQLRLPLRSERQGFPVEQVYRGQAPEQSYRIGPIQALPGSTELEFRLFGGLLDEMEQDLERLLRSPSGCFEQVSSSNYPNLLVLKLLRSPNIQSNIAAERRALDFLAEGYKRLAAYEVKGGGFDWWGRAPAHEALTAYGILQLQDMKRLDLPMVEPALIERALNWLLSRRDGQGGWQKSSKGFQGMYDQAIANAYIVWALAEAGYAHKIEPELEAAYQEALRSQDPYRLALLANAVYWQPDKGQARSLALCQSLLKMQQQGQSLAAKNGSMVGGSGESSLIETQALLVLALNRHNPKDPNISYLLADLQQRKGPYGYGSTQATVLSLKAALAHAQSAGGDYGSGKLSLSSEKSLVLDLDYPLGDRSRLFKQELDSLKGQNLLKVSFSDTEAPRPFEFNLRYQTLQPPNAPDAPLDLSLELADSSLRSGQTLRLRLRLHNRSGQNQGMSMVMLGIPAGLSLQTWQLHSLREQGLFDFYEFFRDYLVLHIEGLKIGESRLINFDLKADIPGRFQAPASSAFPYYNPEQRTWFSPPPVRVD